MSVVDPWTMLWFMVSLGYMVIGEIEFQDLRAWLFHVIECIGLGLKKQHEFPKNDPGKWDTNTQPPP